MFQKTFYTKRLWHPGTVVVIINIPSFLFLDYETCLSKIVSKGVLHHIIVVHQSEVTNCKMNEVSPKKQLNRWQDSLVEIGRTTITYYEQQVWMPMRKIMLLKQYIILLR